MLNIFKRINQTFIDVILLLFYFIVIGFAKIIHIFSNKQIKQKDTYWEEPNKEKLDVYSAY
jgi:hypothetical protein